jgi:hypothetical protein
MRLILRTAAFWLLCCVQQAMPKAAAWAKLEFTTLRLRLRKLPALLVESVIGIGIAFASACPDADLPGAVALMLNPAPRQPELVWPLCRNPKLSHSTSKSPSIPSRLNKRQQWRASALHRPVNTSAERSTAGPS